MGALIVTEAQAYPSLQIGDTVQVDLYGVCVVTRFGKGSVYLKTSKKKEVMYKYPESIKIGSIKKI
jgi:hypothetical protein